MADLTGEIERIDRQVPGGVREVCERLVAGGFEAYAVGGAVRDALLGRTIGDWDVATSAHPDEVTAMFRRTIPTGIQHGTVTVMVGRGDDRQAIEVTTFRGEGAYSDARRPDSVTFGVPLEEDLARRDLVINAMAYDPVARTLHDPFGGKQDLAARRIRAVGDARTRFLEDGLRVMRAIRFAATLEFSVDTATEAAIPVALESLGRVSQERVRVELWKMLAAREPSRGLDIAQRTGVLAVILPELHIEPGLDPGAAERTRWSSTVSHVDAASGVHMRFAALLGDLADAEDPEGRAGVAETILRRLKVSNVDRLRITRLARFGKAWRWRGFDEPRMRRFLGDVGRDAAMELLDLWRAARGALPQDSRERATITELSARMEEILRRGDALSVGELALRGADVMRLTGTKGKLVGVVLRGLLERVIEDPTLNRRDALEELVPVVVDAGS